MMSDMEIEDFFMRRLRENAITPNTSTPLLGNQLKGYYPSGRQTGIASMRHPTRVDQFTEVKVIHNGTVHYNRLEVRDDDQGAATVSKF
jgi:hypothetical protein